MKDPTPQSTCDMPLSGIQPELVERLAEIIKRLELSEIEVADGDINIRVVRQLSSSAGQGVAMLQAAPLPAGPLEMPSVSNGMANAGMVKSPMVGTAYLRSSPTAPAFINIGSKVRAGDKILLVEAMKTFNEILAQREGTVTLILIEDGQPVEYDQALLVIE